ncbi:MAG: AAA family ATPase [Thermoplasmata archaeon]|nr:AAA family ATPase [Thermoplasmata archaeon]
MTKPAPNPSAPASSASPREPSTATLAPEVLQRLQTAIGREVIGYAPVVRALTVALLAEGHVLLEGVPGLAKTYLVRSFARSLDLTFRRIQFTPDMLPADILGATVINPKDQSFEFRPGPIFAHVILADEINRAPPKVQSALLEAMQERQVTIEGQSHPLPRPFMVIATQNPIEQEGTYPLPEAELDRFLFRWVLDYPTATDEVTILRTRGDVPENGGRPPVVTGEELEALRTLPTGIHVSEDLLLYITQVVRETRKDPRIMVGASPRASVHFLNAAKAAAILDGRAYVIPDDVRDFAFAVLSHRVIVRPEALSLAGGQGEVGRIAQSVRGILDDDLSHVDVPR